MPPGRSRAKPVIMLSYLSTETAEQQINSWDVAKSCVASSQMRRAMMATLELD